MFREMVTLKRKVVIILLIGLFVLSGCGMSDDLSTEAVDDYINNKSDANFTETEGNAENAEDHERNESSEDFLKPLEVLVSTKAEDIYYYSEDDIDLIRAVHRCKSDGKNIYLVYGEPDLYVMPIGAGEHNPANIDNPEKMDVCNIAIDYYGRLHLLMAGSNNDEWFIWRLDDGYQVDKIIDVSAYFETKQMPLWFLIDKDGTYYLQWATRRNCILVDSEGMLKHRFTLESLGIRWIYEAATGKDGQIYLVYDNGDEKLEVGELDVGNGSIKKGNSDLYFPEGETFSAMSNGTDTNLLLYSPYSGVWAYDNENGIFENRVPLSDISFGIDTEYWPLTFLPDGRLLMLGKNVDDNHTSDADFLLKYIPVGE